MIPDPIDDTESEDDYEDDYEDYGDCDYDPTPLDEDDEDLPTDEDAP